VGHFAKINPTFSLALIALGVILGARIAAGQDPPLQRIPRQALPTTGALQGVLLQENGLGLGGARVSMRNQATGAEVLRSTTGDGVFLMPELPFGLYDLRVTLPGFADLERKSLLIKAGEVLVLELTGVRGTSMEARDVRDVVRASGGDPLPIIPNKGPDSAYRELIQGRELEPAGSDTQPLEPLPSEARVFQRVPDRWLYEFPEYRRYPGNNGEIQFMKGRTLDPFNRNKLKGDYPIFGGRTFLNLQFASDTFTVGRRIPLPSGVGSNEPDSEEFFGRFGQFAVIENISTSVQLFRGDAAFRPIDWQIKFTPEFNFNYVRVKENGILNIDVRRGPTRYDRHAGVQEAFFEIKLKDLTTEYDFVSARAGIQQFNSDFRGFIFFDQEPGLRIFGNFGNNKYQYNAAAFAMLEKDTNSGLNSFNYRNQNVFIANLYRQDFIKLGYTIQASFHYNKDDATLRYDNNNFLVRPQPIGGVKPHGIRAYYIGVAGDGHIGRINVSHAFYQVLGHDTNNPLSRKRMDINAQMAALELSIDKDWVRPRVSLYFASGEKNPNGNTAHGFDAIFDNPNFNGGFFSFWNREGIRLTGAGVGLVSDGSLNVSLRSSKIQGQASFNNPGIIMLNIGTDIDLTPRLRLFINENFLRFHHTAPLELLLFQKPIRKGVGFDSGIGIKYRPKLSDNIVINAGFNTFVPFQGFKDIYVGKTLFSLFSNIRFVF
jgi:hypothetical protein